MKRKYEQNRLADCDGGGGGDSGYGEYLRLEKKQKQERGQEQKQKQDRILTWQSTVKQYLLSITNIHQDLLPIVLLYANEIIFSKIKTIEYVNNDGFVWTPRKICINGTELVVIDWSSRNCVQVFDVSTGRFLRQIGQTFIDINIPHTIKVHNNKLFASFPYISRTVKNDIYVVSLFDGRLLKTWNDPMKSSSHSTFLRMCISSDDEIMYVANRTDRYSPIILKVISIKDDEWRVLKQIENQDCDVVEYISMDIENDVDDVNDVDNVDNVSGSAYNYSNNSSEKSTKSIKTNKNKNNTLFVASRCLKRDLSMTHQIASVDIQTGQVKQAYVGTHFEDISLSSFVVHGTQIIVGSHHLRNAELYPSSYPMLTVFDRDTGSSIMMTQEALHPSDSSCGWIKFGGVSDLAINNQTQELFICDQSAHNIVVIK